MYVVGLDADRVAGQRVQDPMLNDATRAAVDPENLPTTFVRREERARDLANLLHRLPPGATLSYAVSDADGRSAGPAHQFLQAFRASQGNPSLDYESLRAFLGRPSCAVPSRPAAALDGREVWLASLVDGDLLLDGEAQVRMAHASLDVGLRAAADAELGELSRYHGLVAAAAGRLDPGTHAARCRRRRWSCSPAVRSPGSIATDSTSALRTTRPMIRKCGSTPASAVSSSTPCSSGSLATTSAASRRSPMTAAHRDILVHADTALAEWRARVPPPSEAVFDTEASEIRESALAFLESERQALASGDPGRWMTFELRFGRDHPVELPLEGGPLAVYGYVDRVDDLGGEAAPGDRLQDRIAVEVPAGPEPRSLQRRPQPSGGGVRRWRGGILGGTAVVFEYRFPTVRGDGDPVVYTRREFDAAGGIIGQLLAHVTTGEYVPTTECSDCRYCEHGPVCRVTTDRWGAVSSSRAAWAATHAEGLSAYAAMLARRSAAQ